MPVVIVPEAYRGPTRGQDRIEVDGRSVRQCLEAVEARHPGFLELVLDDRGVAHRFVSLFVNGDELERDALERSVDGADEVEVLSAIAGG